MKTPQVKLSAVARFLREGDRFRHDRREATFLRQHDDHWHDALIGDGLHRLHRDALVEPIQPRLELVRAGEPIAAGDVMTTALPDSLGPQTLRIWRQGRGACSTVDRYRLTRDEPAPLPRQVRRDELAVGDVWQWSRPGAARWEVIEIDGTHNRLRCVDPGTSWLRSGAETDDPRDSKLVTLLRRAAVGVATPPREVVCPELSDLVSALETDGAQVGGLRCRIESGKVEVYACVSAERYGLTGYALVGCELDDTESRKGLSRDGRYRYSLTTDVYGTVDEAWEAFDAEHKAAIGAPVAWTNVWEIEKSLPALGHLYVEVDCADVSVVAPGTSSSRDRYRLDARELGLVLSTGTWGPLVESLRQTFGLRAILDVASAERDRLDALVVAHRADLESREA